MRSLALPSAFLLPVLLLAAPVPKDKEKVKDEDALLGTWVIDKFDAGGDKPPDFHDIKFVFAEKGKFNMIRGPKDRGDGTFKIDPSAKMKTMDVSLDGTTMLAIYELDGDTLKMCIPDKPSSPRPEAFVANAKERVAVVTFKRVRDEKKEEKKDK